MTPEKKEALRLISLFLKVGLQTRSEGIECAKICVDEILNALDLLDYTREFWYLVKKEIELL